MDEAVQRCEDYSEFGIYLSGDREGIYVSREGRRIGRFSTWNDASMFAEVLYERLRLLKHSTGREPVVICST